ncbi:HD domain-containing protein [Candidatus Beckwithbacteria bacterium]|nr:HD domain-containing protein [Candidatus Beckwithbacteria bacterium]
MKRSEILQNIKRHCKTEYAQVDCWVHGISHVQRVVKNGRVLAKAEKLKPKDQFLVELACWLHDIGRAGEESGLLFLQSNHAEVSYQKSKELLQPFARHIGRESLYKVLQAIREHSLPMLKHPENQIACILLDADRGAGLNVIGIFTMLVYLQIVDRPLVSSQTQARAMLPALTQELIEKNKIEAAIERLEFFKGWYYGFEKQPLTNARVAPLYTKSAPKLYAKGIKEIETYINTLQQLQNRQ